MSERLIPGEVMRYVLSIVVTVYLWVRLALGRGAV